MGRVAGVVPVLVLVVVLAGAESSEQGAGS